MEKKVPFMVRALRRREREKGKSAFAIFHTPSDGKNRSEREGGKKRIRFPYAFRKEKKGKKDSDLSPTSCVGKKKLQEGGGDRPKSSCSLHRIEGKGNERSSPV